MRLPLPLVTQSSEAAFLSRHCAVIDVLVKPRSGRGYALQRLEDWNPNCGPRRKFATLICCGALSEANVRSPRKLRLSLADCDRK